MRRDRCETLSVKERKEIELLRRRPPKTLSVRSDLKEMDSSIASDSLLFMESTISTGKAAKLLGLSVKMLPSLGA